MYTCERVYVFNVMCTSQLSVGLGSTAFCVAHFRSLFVLA